MFVLGFIIGFVIGSISGICAIALCKAASERDNIEEEIGK